MYSESFIFSGAEGKYLRGILWMPDTEPLVVIQITHGVTEHMGRWESAARALTAAGIAVAGFDMRGHGEDEVMPGIAVFKEKDWSATLEDMHCFFLNIKQKLPGVPYFMSGLSLGSFLVREYLGLYPDGLAGAVLMGTGQQPGALLALRQALVKTQIKKSGWEATTPLVRQLSFDTYNKKFAPVRTSSDWLCSDETELDKYIADPVCREHMSSGLFWHMLGGMKRTGTPGACKNWNKDMPVLLLSGQEDPVGEMGKTVAKVYAQLLKEGMKDVEMHMVPGSRHDILHEVKSGAAQQAKDILCKWIIEKSK